MDKPKKVKSKSKGDTWTEKELTGATASGSKSHVTKATSRLKAGEGKPTSSTEGKSKKTPKQEDKKRSEKKESPRSSKKLAARESTAEGKLAVQESASSPKRKRAGEPSKKKAHSRTEAVPREYSGSVGSPVKVSSSKRGAGFLDAKKTPDTDSVDKRKSKDRGKDSKKEKDEGQKLSVEEPEKKHKKKEKKAEEKNETEVKSKTIKDEDHRSKDEKKLKSKHEEKSKDSDSRSGQKKGKQVEVVEPVLDLSEVIEEEFEYEEDFDDYEEEFESSEHSPSPVSIPSSPYKPRVSLTSPSLKRKQQRGSHDDSDISDILFALNQENKQVAESREASAHINQEVEDDNEDDDDDDNDDDNDSQSSPDKQKVDPVVVKAKSSAFRRVMDFASAQKKAADQHVSKKAKKRGQELLELIELDIVEFTLFDLPPLSEYELYVKKFGSDSSRQMAVQTGEDNLDQDVQTDPIDKSNVWVQWPPTDFRGYGREDGEGGEGKGVARGVAKEDSIKLAAFLKKAGQVCSILLEENLASQNKAESQTQSPFPFCTDQFLFQNSPSILKGWWMSHADFSQCKDHLIVTSYTQPADADTNNNHAFMGVVCIWNSKALFGPNMVLLAHSATTCCCLSPLKSTLAFAGCADGSVLLWDLREPVSLHEPLNPEARFMGRFPTFNTAGIPQLSNHQSPVQWVGVLSIGDLTSSSQSSSSSPSSEKLSRGVTDPDLAGDGDAASIGLSFQLASLDQAGILKLWVVVELTADDPFGSDSDLGLMPGGRVKLVKSVTIDLSSLPGQSGIPCEVTSIHFHPRDTNHIYVGTGAGFVSHHTRYGQRAIPSNYYPGSSDPSPLDVLSGANASAVTSISFCLQQPDHFLVGCSDGTIRLHHIKRASPLRVMPSSTNGAGIKTIQWVEHCPGIVLVVDHASKLYMWDLVENDAQPVFSKQLAATVSCCKLSLPVQSSVFLLLAYKNSSVELHGLKPLPQELGERQRLLANYLIGLF